MLSFDNEFSSWILGLRSEHSRNFSKCVLCNKRTPLVRALQRKTECSPMLYSRSHVLTSLNLSTSKLVYQTINVLLLLTRTFFPSLRRSLGNGVWVHLCDRALSAIIFWENWLKNHLLLSVFLNKF